MASWLTGNTVQTSNGASAFWTVIQYSTVSQGEDGAYIEWFPYFEVRWGDFWSTTYSTSWGRSGTIEGTQYNPYAPGGTSRVYVEYGKRTYLSASVTDGLNRTSAVGANVSPAVPTWAPNATTNGTATRNSDSQVTLAWTNNSKAARPYSVLKVQRRANGGAWSDIATLAGSATGYIDQTTSAGNYYEYRTYVSNSAGEATGELGTVHMTPTAPTNVQWERVGNTDVKLTMTNTANTATALEVQYRAANSSTWQALTTVSGKVTETTVSVGGGEWYLRVRNTRDTLASAWVETSKVVTIVAPNPPTLNSPASSAVVRKDQASVSLTWKHNPLDGSSQTAAQVRYKIGTGSYTTQTVTTAQSYALALASIAVNSAITWQVRTKGAHADYSAWSEERTFTVRQVPTVSITTPTATVNNTPVNFGFTYNDVSGELRNATVTVSNANGVLFTKSIGNATHGAIERDEYLLDDGGTYTITVNVQSTSTLTSSAQSTFLVKYKKPTSATLARQYDQETGAVNLSVDPMEQSFEYWSDLPTNEQVKIMYGEDSGVHELNVSGKAYAWNQLFDVASATTKTINGVTFTVNSNGSITVNGTATALTNFEISRTAIRKDHVYFTFGCPSNAPSGVWLSLFTSYSRSETGSGLRDKATWVTADVASTPSGIRIPSGAVCNNLVFWPNGFDATLIYGAGNEPSTVAKFRADYPEAFYPYDAGSVKTVDGSIGVKSDGKNLFDYESMVPGYNSGTTNEAIQPQSSTAKEKTSQRIYVDQLTKYTLHIKTGLSQSEVTSTNYLWFSVKEFDKNGAFISERARSHEYGKNEAVFTWETKPTCAYLRISFRTYDTFGEPYAQLELGTVATPYTPYVQPTQSSIDLQGNVLASLPDGTRDELTVDAAGNVRLVKPCRVGNLGEWSWVLTGNYFVGTINDGSKYVKFVDGNTAFKGLFSNGYKTIGSSPLNAANEQHIAVANARTFYVRDSRFSTAADFAAYASTVSFVYELATPQTIDLGTIDPIEFVLQPGYMTGGGGFGNPGGVVAPSAEYEVLTNIETKQGVATYNGGLPTVSYDLQRVNPDGTAVTLAQDLTGHTDYLDRYAPCNIGYEYRVVTYAESGAFRETLFGAKFVTPYWYLMAGNLTAKAKYNPLASETIECEDANMVRYAGRRYPVLYEADAITDTHEAGGVVIGREAVDPFIDIQRNGGKAVYKSNDGDVIHVHGSTEIQRNMTLPPTYEVSVSMERIDGGVL